AENKGMERSVVIDQEDRDRDRQTDEPAKQRVIYAAERKTSEHHANDRGHAAVPDRRDEGADRPDNHSSIQIYATQVEHVLRDSEANPGSKTVNRPVDEK